MINATEFRKLSKKEKQKKVSKLNDEEIQSLYYNWEFWARKDQIEPPQLGKKGVFIWFIKAGRGYGKTRTLAEWVIEKVQNQGYRHVSLVGAASDEVRSIMIEGEAGIMACSPHWFYPDYEPSKKRITWPNGAVANIYYGSEPDKSRGAQSDLIWCDEIAKWKYPEKTFDNLMFGLRLGKNPLCGVSSTPRPTKFIKSLIARKDVIVTQGSSYDNVDNLSEIFTNSIIIKYKGTRLGRQEIEGLVLDDNPNALWTRKDIDDSRITERPDCYKVVVAIDPQASDNAESSETGIVVVGEGKALPDMPFPKLPHYYIFEDLTISGSPKKWASAGITGYNKYQADKIIAEKNNGGDMVKSTINNVDDTVPVSLVWASRGKYIRAEPVSALSEQGRIHHIGTFPELEDQLCIAENTNIHTKDGIKKIQKVEAGDFVLTRKGFKRVKNTRCNGIKNIYCLTSNNNILYATGDHKVFINNKGFIKASDIKKGDTAICLTRLENIKHLTNQSITKEKVTGITESQVNKGVNWRNGCGKTKKLKVLNVLDAEKSSNQHVQEQDFVVKNVEENTIIISKNLKRKMRVYDIEVEEENEFFANNILVHNCEWVPGEKSPDRLDAYVWGVSYLAKFDTNIPVPVTGQKSRKKTRSKVKDLPT